MLIGDLVEIVDEFVMYLYVLLIMFMGGVVIGKVIVVWVGYWCIVLELGGNDLLIVFVDVDFDCVVLFVVLGLYWNLG